MHNELKHKDQIFELIQQNNFKIRSFGVKRMGLFGSFVKNKQTQDSDLDFIVEFEKGKKSYKSFINLVYFLEELFGRKVDLLTEKSLSPYFGTHILNETEYVSLSN